MSHRTVQGKTGSGKSTIVVSDRYLALGIQRPKPSTVCRGQCEGVGLVPIHRDDMSRPWRALWLAAEKKSPAKGGWHFVKCPTCGGTGKRA